MSRNQPMVMALMDVPSIVSICEKQEIVLDRATRIQLIRFLLNAVGPHFGYQIIQHMMRRGINTWASDDYEVEKVLDHVNEKGEDFYLIKWKGWSTNFNSWEKSANLDKCQDLLEDFKQRLESKESDKEMNSRCETREEQLKTILDYLNDRYDDQLLSEMLTSAKEIKKLAWMLRTRRTRFSSCNKLNKNSKMHKAHKAELGKILSAWENQMNRDAKFGHISVENKVDLEGPPVDFVFISSCFHSNAVTIKDTPAIGCKCKDGDCLSSRRFCCGASAGYDFAYTKLKRLRISEGQAIYECNKNCSCDESCPNRVVQLGRKVPLVLFRTSNGRGWGVKAGCEIKKGTFVEEYVGEVITSEEAEKRGQIYDVEGLTYLFDLDFHEKDCAFTIDAKTCGNISHFINHSCQPNLGVFNVWIENHDERLPRIALFATRNIKNNEELTFDYKMDGNNILSEVDKSSKSDDVAMSCTVEESDFMESELPSNPLNSHLNIGSFKDSFDRKLTLDAGLMLESNNSVSVQDSKYSSRKIVTKNYDGKYGDGILLGKELKVILTKTFEASANTTIDFEDENFVADTPSASSISVPDVSSVSESQTDGMMLCPHSRRKNPSNQNTRSWVKSGGRCMHNQRSKVVQIRRLEKKKLPSSGFSESLSECSSQKRMRILCNCGATNCRKWLC